MADRRGDKLTSLSQIASLVCIGAEDETLDDSYMKQIDVYGGDVVRLSLLLSSSLTDEAKSPVFSLETLHRFIHKRWNASRLITMTAREADLAYTAQ